MYSFLECLVVIRGQLTFDAEGNDNPVSRFFSRIPRVPTTSSGITLGRGYDLSERKQKDVDKHLKDVGINKKTAEKISNGVKLKGKKATDFLKKNRMQRWTLTHKQQKKLFYIAYHEMAADAKCIATDKEVEKKYGKTDWNKLNNAIKAVVIDLRFRGEYTAGTRIKIQSSIVANDLKSCTKLIGDEKYWVRENNVPKDRFQRRKDFLEKALTQ